MRYLSVCSGIEAATVAWHPLGWTPVAFSEIEKFPSAVLAHHYPNSPNLGDMTQHEHWPIGPGSVDLLVGGTPCQSFSVAGLRKGLADPRGNLALTYLAIADRLRPRWLVWENVPGVLSSSGGRDFGSFLGALAELGYGFAYRVLDAQYFGVAQRRRRVFVVGHLGDWRRAAAVLFERESLRGDPAPSREAREAVAGTLGARTSSGGGFSTDFESAGGLQPVAQIVTSHDVAHAIPDTAKCVTTGEAKRQDWETCTIIPAPVAIQGNLIGQLTGDIAATMGTPGSSVNASGPTVMQAMAVRRLTPIECERLQGFPDGYTAIPWRGKPATECPDGPRYRALGNSMAVPVMRWIGERIGAVERLCREVACGR